MSSHKIANYPPAVDIADRRQFYPSDFQDLAKIALAATAIAQMFNLFKVAKRRLTLLGFDIATSKFDRGRNSK